MPSHALDIRVYYEDTDAGGVVYHANYLKYFERGRSEFLRDTGLDQLRLLREDGLGFVVRRCAVEYLAPARLGDTLRVISEPVAATAATLRLAQSAWLEARRIVEAEVVVAMVDREGRPQRLPAALRALGRGAAAPPNG